MIEETIKSVLFKIADSIIKNQQIKQGVFNQKDLAKYLDCDVNTLKKYYIYEPDFPVIPRGSKFIYPRKGVDEWIADHTVTYKEVA
ncbi:hypothetical protein IV37_GL000147 [Fructilactobacillus fructivorans]|uniref:helix-turn-helix domain-containing protein n=1 Tax=Fructilactobacillus fructivorans TaxID=1614 RepID=UPI000704F9D9|nr:helix-turn-helix domain-containing protein [Fructilactobacillus fructivorans]KRN13430.1 hypothetical protein IV37_GL000147 [Fructilactobacillus fructivorans]